MKSRVAGLVAAVALVALLPGAPASAAGRCSSETIVLNTFHIELKALKKRYRIGETAKIALSVTRPAHSDPAGLGVEWGEPPKSFPAEEVNVGIGLQVNGVFLPGYAKTDKEGKATIGVPLPSYTPSGTAAASALSWLTSPVNTPCLVVEEQGFRAHPALFKVTR